MASLDYEDVTSRFYAKVEAFDFIYENISDETMDDFIFEWIRSSIAYPYIRRLFKTVDVDDDRGIITYDLRYKLDDYSDQEFVIELLASAMVRAWVKPKVFSITNILQYMGTSDGRFYSQAMHLSELRALLEDTEKEIRGMIRDRGYLNNSYIDGGK